MLFPSEWVSERELISQHFAEGLLKCSAGIECERRTPCKVARRTTVHRTHCRYDTNFHRSPVEPASLWDLFNGRDVVVVNVVGGSTDKFIATESGLANRLEHELNFRDGSTRAPTVASNRSSTDAFGSRRRARLEFDRE